MIDNDSNRQIAVFKLIDSPTTKYVINVNMNIPETKDKNLPGQNSPWNPSTAYLVASINRYVIGTPQNIKAQRHSFAQVQIIGPFTCIQTINCPTVNNNADNAMYFRFIYIL